MNTTTTLTARPHRAWPAVVLTTLAVLTVAIVIAVTAYAVNRSSGNDRPVPATAVTNTEATPTPGNGLRCPSHQPC